MLALVLTMSEDSDAGRCSIGTADIHVIAACTAEAAAAAFIIMQVKMVALVLSWEVSLLESLLLSSCFENAVSMCQHAACP